MFNHLLSNRFIRSGAVYSLTSFFVSILSYVINLSVARGFSLSDYGEYSSALSYGVFLGVPLSAFSLVIIKRIGRADATDKQQVALSIEQWLQHEIVTFIPFIFGLSLILAFGMYYQGNMSLTAITFVLVNTFLGIFAQFYGSVLQSYKNFFRVGIFSILSTFSKLLFVLFVIFVKPTLLTLFGAIIFSGVFSFILGRTMIRTGAARKTKEILFAKVKSYVLKKSVLIPLFTTLGIVGLSNIDVILVKKFFESDTVGLYSSLSLLGKIILYLASPLSAVAYTFFTGKDSKHESGKILLLLTALIGAVGFGATMVYAAFPNFVVRVVFGEKFLGVADLIWLAACFGTVYSLMNTYAQYFVAKGSRFAVLGILAVVIQTIGIYIAHSTLFEVLVVNILINGGLLIIYMGEVLRREFWYGSNPVSQSNHPLL